MKFGFVFLVIILILSGFVFAIENHFKNFNSDNIATKFEDGEKTANVVLKINDNLNFKSSKFKNSYSKNSPRYVTRTISFNEFKELQSDPTVEKIFSENHLHAFLEQATDIIDSDLTNNLNFNSINLTGSGQVVCVIDSGVNFSHSDLFGKNISCVIDCFDKVCVENCSIGDDNGHGTHVAGIVAASDGITGVAPNVSLIGVRVLDSSGDGSDNDNDLSNAIDWCVDHSANVITMSLGTTTLFSSNCDNIITNWRNSINAAVAQNITVVAASGNDGNYTHISAPACMSNAIAVGDTYDANLGSVGWLGICTDSTTAPDKIICHANRNSLVKLFAPGALINSTSNSGGYVEYGGTSMATPMVASAIAIINQYLSLSGQTKTPSEIENILYETGKKIADGDNTFSRINVYEAILSIDVDAPNVTLHNPANEDINLNFNQTFICSSTDWQLSNVTFKIWNSSELYYDETKNITGTNNSTEFNLTDMPYGSYNWNCFVTDAVGNVGNATNFTLTITGIRVGLISPPNDFYTNINETNFTCNSSSNLNNEISNVTFKIWNSSGDLIYNLSKDVSGFNNQSIFNYTFLIEGNYTWECSGFNNKSDFDSKNFTLYYDIASPNIFSQSVSVGQNSATINWNTNEETNASVYVSVGYWTNSSAYKTNQSIYIGSLSSSTTYNYYVTSCDRAGNCNSSSQNQFTTSATVDNGGSSGGGGGGGGIKTNSVLQTYTIGSSDISSGYTKILSKNEKINFSLFDFRGDRHLLTLNDVGGDYVNLTVESEPITFMLGIGQSIKLNLTSADYYDLLIKLNNISNGKAELTIQLISEPIEKIVIETIVEEKIVETEVIKNGYNLGIIIILLIVLVLIFFVVIMANRKRLKSVETYKIDGKDKKIKT